jgi:hypothetical protein
MNVLIPVLTLVVIGSATIIGIMYVAKKTKTSEDELFPIENPEVIIPTLPSIPKDPTPPKVEVVEPLKETVAPAPKPKKRYKHNKPKPKV